MQGNTNRRIVVQTSPGIKQDPISKLNNAKRAGRVSQGVEYLLNKYEAPGSTPSTASHRKKFKIIQHW
jgi:hypothetical protein